MRVVVEYFLENLLGCFEGEICAADHQQRSDQEGRNRGEQECHGEQQQELVLDRAPRDLADDRQLALRRKTGHIARRDCRIVDDYAGRLAARLDGRAGNVVERRRRELGDGCDVVEQSDQSGGHGMAVRRTCPRRAIRASPRPCLGWTSSGTISLRSRRRSATRASISTSTLWSLPPARCAASGLRSINSAPSGTASAHPSRRPRRMTARRSAPRRRKPERRRRSWKSCSANTKRRLMSCSWGCPTSPSKALQLGRTKASIRSSERSASPRNSTSSRSTMSRWSR